MHRETDFQVKFQKFLTFVGTTGLISGLIFGIVILVTLMF